MIKSHVSLAVLAVFELVIWIIPVFFFRKVNDPENLSKMDGGRSIVRADAQVASAQRLITTRTVSPPPLQDIQK